MSRLSSRARLMPASPIRRLVPLADRAKARGVHVHHLNIGQPDVETPRPLIEAYHRFDDKVLAYGPSTGLPALREAVANYYERIGHPVPSRNIHVTTGGSEALVFAIGAIADPGDELVVFEPFYANYAGFGRLLDVGLKAVVTRAQDGFRLPPDEAIERAIGPKTRGIIICSPGNPTGTVYTREELDRLARLVKKHDLVLISDEVYREFSYEGTATSALALGIDDRVIVCDSISKRFSACGARVGFVLTRNDELSDVFLRFGFARLCPATVDQLAAIAAYQLPPSFFEPVVAEYRARRDALVDGLNAIPGVHTYRPEGAFYTVATFPVKDADDFCQWLLNEFSQDGKTVMMAPANGFYATPGEGQKETRIAYVLNVPALQESVRLLAAALKVYPGREA